MGLTKLLYSGIFDSEIDVGISLIEDPVVMRKTASTIFGMSHDELKPDDKHVGLHITALGASERYGCNRNFDAFPKLACIDRHNTFVTHGKVYRHHRNKDPNNSLGFVKASAYNDSTDRIELMIHANKEAAADELSRLEREGEIPFSMGCHVPNDRCSICGTLRKNASDPNQCDHIKNELGKLAEDGTVVCMYNDEPTFFDISFVGRPADRIAWNLKTAGALPTSVDLAVREGLEPPDAMTLNTDIALRKQAHLKRMVDLQAVYSAWFTKTASPRTTSDYHMLTIASGAGTRIPDDVITELRDYAPERVFSTMAKLGTVMDVRTFFKYATGTEYNDIQGIDTLMDDVESIIPKVAEHAVKAGRCHRICADTEFDVVASDSPYASGLPAKLTLKLAEASLIGDNAESRIMETVISGKYPTFNIDNNVKIGFNENMTVKLAEKYLAYKLSAVDAAAGGRHDTYVETLMAAAAAQNLARG